jgi:D-3-phosphoglycerate dehydrogenase / 2-oxoglutarate reductase
VTEIEERQGGPATAGGPVVVIPEPIAIMGWSYEVERSMLEPLGIRLVIAADRDEAREAIRTADVVFTSSAITADDIATLDNAVGIVCYSVGMDYVDARAAAAKGIPIWNCPTSNNEEVSDHAILMILAAQRRLLRFATAATKGNWDVYEDPELRQIHRIGSRTIGIIGLGRIGHLVARKLHGFGPTVIAYDPYIPGSRDPEVELVSLDELCARADIIVSCAALTDTSRGLIDREMLAKTKPGVIVVNVSRGGIVDEEALREALDSGHVAHAALDVRSPEPPDPANDLLTSHPRVTLTQHIAASSVESVAGLHVEAAGQIIKLLREAGRLPAAP